jgi:hypothetical protein
MDNVFLKSMVFFALLLSFSIAKKIAAIDICQPADTSITNPNLFRL